MVKRPPHEETLPPPPRSVRARRGRGWVRGCLLLMLVPHVWCGALLPLLALHHLAGFLRFRLFGTVVPGRVHSLYRSHHRGTSYHVRYTFVLRGGQREAEATVDEPAFGRLAAGDPVEVRVLAGSSVGPELLVDGARGPGGDLWKMWLFIAFWDGVLLVFVWQACIPPLRQRGLVRNGVTVLGLVTDKQQRKGKQSSYKVHYRYKAPTPDAPGESVEWPGVMSVPEKDYDGLRIGERVMVLYDPRKPRRSLLYRCADYEVVLA
jgi:hypothetical protein